MSMVIDPSSDPITCHLNLMKVKVHTIYGSYNLRGVKRKGLVLTSSPQPPLLVATHEVLDC